MEKKINKKSEKNDFFQLIYTLYKKNNILKYEES